MKFIRIDEKGEWRGVEHVSSLNGMGGECWCEGGCTCGDNWEEGISCYKLDNIAEALENIRAYWVEEVGLSIEDFKTKQITIFEGELLDTVGADWEDLATCDRTLFEFDAYDIMKAVIEKHSEYNYDEITKEEYEEFLTNLIAA